jgi:hypothetical protein
MFQANTRKQTESTGKQYLYEVAPDGIWKGMRVLDWKLSDDKRSISFEMVQETSGKFHTETFYSPNFVESADRKADSAKRIEIMLSQLEDMFSALVPANNNNGTRWGTDSPAFETFEEFCNFYTNQIDKEKMPLFDFKALYKAGIVYKNAGDKFAKAPKRERGGQPFISSEYLPRTLSADYDTNEGRGNYRKYLTFKTEELEATVVDDLQIPASQIGGTDSLPF